MRRIHPSRKNSFFLFGARGTGKSTFIQQQFFKEANLKKVIFIDLLDTAVEDYYLRDPKKLEELSADIEWVVIDEVQKAPRLLDHVHRLIEAKKHKFILTGSSSRKLKRGGANLLAGRAFLEHLFPFTYSEISHDFKLNTALHWGTLPTVYNLDTEKDKIKYLQSYVQNYIKEEIQVEQLVRNITPFRKFLEIAGLESGKIISYSNIAADVGADPKTIESYFQILEDTHIGYLLNSFHRSVRKSQKVHPKFYLFDLGVKNAMAGSLHDSLNEKTYAFGNAFEHLIILEIIRLNNYTQADYRLSYLRTKDGAEIDIILSRGKKDILIEIKSYTRVDNKDVNKLNQFKKDMPGSTAYLLSRDEHKLNIDGIFCLPWQLGLKQIFRS